jgi:hypothetical protein
VGLEVLDDPAAGAEIVGAPDGSEDDDDQEREQHREAQRERSERERRHGSDPSAAIAESSLQRTSTITYIVDLHTSGL